MHIETLLRSWAAQFEKDRSAPLSEGSALMLSAANEIASLRREASACRSANEGLDKAMWEARDLLAEIDAELDRQLYDDEFVRQCRNNDLDIPRDCEHHIIIRNDLWRKISEAAEPSKQSGFPYPETEPAF